MEVRAKERDAGLTGKEQRARSGRGRSARLAKPEILAPSDPVSSLAAEGLLLDLEEGGGLTNQQAGVVRKVMEVVGRHRRRFASSSAKVRARAKKEDEGSDIGEFAEEWRREEDEVDERVSVTSARAEVQEDDGTVVVRSFANDDDDEGFHRTADLKAEIRPRSSRPRPNAYEPSESGSDATISSITSSQLDFPVIKPARLHGTLAPDANGDDSNNSLSFDNLSGVQIAIHDSDDEQTSAPLKVNTKAKTRSDLPAAQRRRGTPTSALRQFAADSPSAETPAWHTVHGRPAKPHATSNLAKRYAHMIDASRQLAVLGGDPDVFFNEDAVAEAEMRRVLRELQAWVHRVMGGPSPHPPAPHTTPLTAVAPLAPDSPSSPGTPAESASEAGREFEDLLSLSPWKPVMMDRGRPRAAILNVEEDPPEVMLGRLRMNGVVKGQGRVGGEGKGKEVGGELAPFYTCTRVDPAMPMHSSDSRLNLSLDHKQLLHARRLKYSQWFANPEKWYELLNKALPNDTEVESILAHIVERQNAETAAILGERSRSSPAGRSRSRSPEGKSRGRRPSSVSKQGRRQKSLAVAVTA
ncbi:hypothetical protein HK101_000255 [Irineochytrium annulatum]|nr:hypothetical protein HK101_000255 [Irineochytrium annulatum]